MGALYVLQSDRQLLSAITPAPNTATEFASGGGIRRSRLRERQLSAGRRHNVANQQAANLLGASAESGRSAPGDEYLASKRPGWVASPPYGERSRKFARHNGFVTTMHGLSLVITGRIGCDRHHRVWRDDAKLLECLGEMCRGLAPAGGSHGGFCWRRGTNFVVDDFRTRNCGF
jgi:hypothetical protein